jgi:predicted dehydrogenase
MRRWVASILLAVVRGLVRLPSGVQAALLGGVERLLRLIAKGRWDLQPLVEIKDVIRRDPQGRRAVREILLKGRREQLVSYLSGVLRHYASGGGEPLRSFARVRVDSKKMRPSPVRVTFLGEHHEFEFLRQAYADRPGCEVLDPQLDVNAALDQAHGVEVALDRPEAVDWARAAVARGLAVSLHLGPRASPEALRSLLATSEANGAWRRVFYAPLYWRSVEKLRALVADGEIGELGTVRVRATLGGRGGTRTMAAPFGDRPLDHPAFDHFLLLPFLGGPVSHVTAYVQPMDAAGGGQALVDCRYAAPGRYALLECTYAPELTVRSPLYPHDLEIEVAGTDGIIWLRRGTAERTQEPPLTVRTGRTAYTIGVEAGLPEPWPQVYRAAAAELAEAARGRLVERMTTEEILSAVQLRERVYEVAAGRQVARL